MSIRSQPAAGWPTILKVMTLEAQTIARACGKNHLHNLEPEDLCALTIEASAMAGVPLAGTTWIPGQGTSDPGSGQDIRKGGPMGRTFGTDAGADSDLREFAKAHGIKYFMVSYTDLFGGQRAKLVPASAIGDMQKDGAGFAGFATWLDLTPAHPDMLAVPDPASVYSAALEARCRMAGVGLPDGGQERCPGAPQHAQTAGCRGGKARDVGADRRRTGVLPDFVGRQPRFPMSTTRPTSPATISRR